MRDFVVADPVHAGRQHLAAAKPSNCLITKSKALRIAWLENFKGKYPIVCVFLWSF